MVLGKLPVLGRPTILITVGQGLIALAVGGGGFDIFTLIYPCTILVPGRPTLRITVGQGRNALVVGAGGFFLWTFLLSSIFFSPLSPSLWGTAIYRLYYCLKGSLNQNQPTYQHLLFRQTNYGITIVYHLKVKWG